MNDPKKWEYAGDADTKTWHTWKDHSNNQGEDGLGKSLFEYNEDALPHKTQVWPDTTYQENPEKM